MQKTPMPPRSPIFVPRITLFLLAGFALFAVIAMLYSLPILLESPPPGATPDYLEERVRAHLDGVTPWFLIGSFLTVGLISARWMKR